MYIRDLFGAVVISGVYSLLMAAIFTQLDAVDVAFTEASVGAGISTVLLLATLALIKNPKTASYTLNFPGALWATMTGALLMYTVPTMPLFGRPENPVHQHVAPRYISETPEVIGIPNVVTSVLADYRGFDTLGEVTVIFTAGVGVLLLLGRRRVQKK
tara:strand:- start:148 stop:621 length:474 start_codon:yes stop_codon:yes gene_type:complete